MTCTSADPANAVSPVRRFAREALGFVGVGVVASGLQLVVFNLLVHRVAGPLTSNAVAILVATAVSYTGNRYLSFSHRRSAGVRREAGVFAAINGATFVLAELILAAAYLGHHEHERLVLNILSVVGVGVGTIIRFWAYRRFVFVGRRSGQRGPAGARVTAQHLQGAVAD